MGYNVDKSGFLIKDEKDEAVKSFFLGMGINPDDNFKPYVHSPKDMVDKNKTFLDNWWNGLTPEQQNKIKNVPHYQSGSNEIAKDTPIVLATPFIAKDQVNSPSHYTVGKIEAIDYLKDSMPIEAYIGYLEGAVKKYLHRFRYKGKPVEDLRKAYWYLNKLIEAMEGK